MLNITHRTTSNVSLQTHTLFQMCHIFGKYCSLDLSELTGCDFQTMSIADRCLALFPLEGAGGEGWCRE